MFLQEFQSTDLQRNIGRVLKVVYKKPVLITRQRGEGFVMLSKKEYARLVKASGGGK